MSFRWIVAAVVACLGIAPGAAFACSCVPMTRAEMLALSDLAFRGDVVAVWLSEDGQSELAKVLPGVDIKGHAPPSVTVTTSRHPTMCGYHLELGRSYDFAGKLTNGDRMSISLCSMVPMNHVEVPR